MLNADKPYRWNTDTQQSVLQYNDWFMKFAPKAFQDEMICSRKKVDDFFALTQAVTTLSPQLIIENPSFLGMLRMFCSPPLARDRLAGLSGVSRSLVKQLEEGILPRQGKEKASFYDARLACNFCLFAKTF